MDFIGFEILCDKFWNKKNLMMSTGTCGIKLHAQNNILKKNKNKYEIWNHLYFGPSFFFVGLL